MQKTLWWWPRLNMFSLCLHLLLSLLQPPWHPITCHLCSCHSAFEHAYTWCHCPRGSPPIVFTEMSLFPARLPLEINFPTRSIMVSYFGLQCLPSNSFIHFLVYFLRNLKNQGQFLASKNQGQLLASHRHWVLAGRLHKQALCSSVCRESSQVGLCRSYFRPGF